MITVDGKVTPNQDLAGLVVFQQLHAGQHSQWHATRRVVGKSVAEVAAMI